MRQGLSTLLTRLRSGAPRCALIAPILLAVVSPRPGNAEATVSGVATITHAEGDRGRQLNKANRDDTQFNTYRLLLNGAIDLSEHVDLELQILWDEGANNATTLTFVQPWIRYREVGGRKWLNVQAGKLPLMFGTFGERVNTRANPVIATPLISGYHTSLRHNVVPMNGDSLIARRGFGQFGVNYADPKGTGFKGMPMIYEACWSSGVELFGAAGVLEYSGAITYGSQSVPMVDGQEINDEPGYVGRLGLSRLPGALFGARFGVSAATGAYMPRNVTGLAPKRRVEDYDQIVVGTDLEYGLGPVVVRGEAMWNRFETPANETPARWLPSHLDTFGYYVEGLWTITPVWSLGGRWDALNFHDITSPARVSSDWDADVNRYEICAGWRPDHRWELRYAYQGWRFPELSRLNTDFYALQLVTRF